MSRLNEMMLEILVDLARRPEVPPVAYSIVTPLRDRLRRLDAESRRRVAVLPFLLVDLCLTEEGLWETALHPRRHSVERRRRCPEDSRAVALSRGVTLLAWHVVQSNAGGAAVHFGISPGVAALLRTADVLDLDTAAARVAPHCRPRWSDRPSAWLYLLTRSNAEPSPMRDQTVYGLQLIGSDLLSGVSAQRTTRSHRESVDGTSSADR
jgi:hypothetical protein